MGYKDAGRIHMKPTEALNSQELMPPSAGGMNSSRAVGKRRLLLHTQELWSIVEKQRMGSTVEGSQRNTLSCPILSCCCLRRPSSTRSQKARESGCRSYTSASQGTEQGEGGARGTWRGKQRLPSTGGSLKSLIRRNA